MIRAILLLCCLLPEAATAFEISLPATARQTVTRDTAPDTFAAPVGVFDGYTVPTLIVEGAVQRGAWRIESPGLTAFQVMRPLREQLEAAGFDIVLDCAAKRCGGFDFRFAVETLPGPNMYVNIRSFHYVTGLRETGGEITEAVSLFASTSATAAYVQLIHAGAEDATAPQVETTAEVPLGEPLTEDSTLATRLGQKGFAVLRDLDFELGSTALGPGPFESLVQLAAFLDGRPELRVALVGHTDTVGGLQPNIEISRERARSVRTRLIEEFGVDAARLDAEGMGYLAPVASNLDPAGRDANRRVEVVLLGAE